MPRVLTTEMVDAYRRDGCVFPIPIVSGEEAAELRRHLEAFEARIGMEAQKKLKIKAHLPFPWLSNLIRHPRLLDAVEDIIGPNILCWGSSFFSKNAHDPRFVSWHQDTTYYGLEPPETLTAWLAFTESNVVSGCMRFIPGTHTAGRLSHEEHKSADNLLSRGQTLKEVDEARAVNILLKPGEISFHSEMVVHGSSANNSDDRRIGFSIHYIAPQVRQTQFENATASLVRGVDTHGHWLPEPIPQEEWDPVCVAAMDQAWEQYLAAMQNMPAA